MNALSVQPWYRNVWPWLLMIGPACAVLGGAATLWLALLSDDGLVADDYYKQGMAINRTLAREKLAQQRGYRAQVEFADSGSVRVALSGPPGAALPAAVRLRIVHPTRAGGDEVIVLRPAGHGAYVGTRTAALARRTLILEDVAQSWRLTGALESGQTRRVGLGQ